MEKYVILSYDRYLSLLECNNQKPSKFDEIITNEDIERLPKQEIISDKNEKNVDTTNVDTTNEKISKISPPIKVLLDKIPQKHSKKARKLLDYISHYKNIIDWNDDNYNIIIHGKTIKNSNIVDLIKDAITRNKQKIKLSESIDAFYKALMEIKTPFKLIFNEKRKPQLIFYKSQYDKNLLDIKVKKWIRYPHSI
jgi:hypothetical protein